VGCELYKVGARLRGIQTRQLDRLELTDVGGTVPTGELVVAFSHPLCTDCRALIDGLEADGTPHLEVDVRARPDLARKYGIAVVPTALTVLPDGTVTARLTG
jgi:thioredoxin-like negative regulator of GroEL